MANLNGNGTNGGGQIGALLRMLMQGAVAVLVPATGYFFLTLADLADHVARLEERQAALRADLTARTEERYTRSDAERDRALFNALIAELSRRIDRLENAGRVGP